MQHLCLLPGASANTSEHVTILGSPSYVPPSAVLVNAGPILLGVLLYFGGFLVGHFILGLCVCLDQGGGHFSFLSFFCLFCFCSSLGVSSLRGCVEIFADW